jgi:hypothetical protein
MSQNILTAKAAKNCGKERKENPSRALQQFSATFAVKGCGA